MVRSWASRPTTVRAAASRAAAAGSRSGQDRGGGGPSAGSDGGGSAESGSARATSTALFLWSAIGASSEGGSTGAAVLGAVLGLATAVLLGWLIYRGALRLNLAVFFRWTGAALIVVAAGVLAYGVHDLQEAGLLPGLDNLAFDVSSTIVPGTLVATLIKGVFNLSPAMTVLEVVVWVGYLVPTMILYFRPAREAAARVPAPAEAREAAPTPESAG